jgi:hypothetical protein
MYVGGRSVWRGVDKECRCVVGTVVGQCQITDEFRRFRLIWPTERCVTTSHRNREVVVFSEDGTAGLPEVAGRSEYNDVQ